MLDSMRSLDWSWLAPTVGGALLTALLGIGGFFIGRWWRRRGTTAIHIGDREPCEYVMRGQWNPDGKSISMPPPRFLNFVIPLTITNKRDVPLTIRVKNVWFCDQPPEFRKDGWTLPGSSLHPLGVRVEDAAGQIADPAVIPPRGMAHIRLVGTATSPVIFADPFLSWRYVFVDWISEPSMRPLVQFVDEHGGGRRYEPDLKPTFAMPEHYPGMREDKVQITWYAQGLRQTCAKGQ